MKVFISWSGKLSKEAGEVFREWLPSMLQVVQPYFTPDDVEKGARWSSEIAGELEESQVGILLLTKENLKSEWISFEAGALSKQMDKSRICTVLFGIDKTDLTGPLVQFQATSFERTDVHKLVQTINNCCGENKLADTVLESAFNKWWPELKEKVDKILETYKGKSTGSSRRDRDILEEILSLSRVAVERGESRGLSAYSINPKAIQDLRRYFVAVKAALPKRTSVQLRESISQLESVIRYIYRRVVMSSRAERHYLRRAESDLSVEEIESDTEE